VRKFPHEKWKHPLVGARKQTLDVATRFRGRDLRKVHEDQLDSVVQ
jgi:hypothetical protein